MADYSLVRKLNWDGDVLHVHDTVREISSNIEFQTEDFILKHFDADLSDFREYMHDKIKWEQKQLAAMPKWIPVTETDRLPKQATPCLVSCNQWGGVILRIAIFFPDDKSFFENGADITKYDTHYFSGLKPPKGEENAEEQTT
jgi:hypothetical protein